MDKNKNRTDLLAAGRKKIQQYLQKKDGKGSKPSGKANKSDRDVVTDEASSVAKSEKGKKQLQATESFSIVEEKLHDSGYSLKALQEHVLEVKMELGKLQMTLLAFNQNKRFSGDFHVSDIEEKRRSQTREQQQRNILRMLEKSLARELDLEKELTESKKDKQDLKLKLQSIEQEALNMEEAAEVIWDRLLEAENAAVILMGISRDLVTQHQLNLDGFNQREDVLRSKLDNCIDLLNVKDSNIEKLNNKITQLVADNLQVSTLREKVKLLEEKVKESESNSNIKKANASHDL